MPVPAPELTDRASHFDFGKNWHDYSKLIDDERLDLAIESMKRIVPDLAGKTFLDIGSGSGLFALAALRLGAARVHAVDIDEHSVETTRRVLSTFAAGLPWVATQTSVFDLSPAELGTFDVVYSWGVLHHTGDMWRAIDCAAAMVAPGGAFAFALYQKTPLCGAWRLEKRLYMRAPAAVQKLLRRTYLFSYQAARIASGRGIRRGALTRGMNVDHDIHDWLGGYPYESTRPPEVRAHMDRLGFQAALEQPARVYIGGLFGTGCSEYLYKRSEDIRKSRDKSPTGQG